MQEATYVLDITDAREFARHNKTITGIQRVVLRAIAHLIKSRPSHVKMICFDTETGKAVEVQSDWCTPDYDFSADDFDAWFNVSQRTILEWAQRNPDRPLLQSYDLARASFNRLTGRKKFFNKRSIAVTASQSKIIGPYQPCQSDIVIILGSIWHFHKCMDSLVDYRELGARIIFLIHDLIPEKLPDLTPADLIDEFSEWLPRAYSVAEGLIANSFYTASDIEEDLAARLKQLPVEVAQLAHELAGVKPTGALIRGHVHSAASQPYVLYFGTIAKRKNLFRLARVWRDLGKELGSDTPKLYLAGKPDWGHEEVIAAVAESNGLISIIDRPSDAELAYLIQNCMFTVYPSLYEGWGLPIGESLWLGKTCVASNTSSMPEAGGDMCAYFDPTDPDEMYVQLKRMIVDADYRVSFEARIKRDKLRTWGDFSRSLETAIGRIVARTETAHRPAHSTAPQSADSYTITMDTSPSSAP